jgi:hypothetical protein
MTGDTVTSPGPRSLDRTTGAVASAPAHRKEVAPWTAS